MQSDYEFLMQVLETCDPASDCAIGNEQIWRAKEIINGIYNPKEQGPTILSEAERDALIEHVKSDWLDHSFGDNQEEEYVMFGFPIHKGLINMTDEELLVELGHYEEGDSTDVMVAKWRNENKEGDS